ncbi:MAG: hypothetical protein ACYTG7_02990 [Planctomycetota bacterium]|jgi:hypothetical protein
MSEERQVLSHKPVRGYKPVFFIAIIVAVVYLALAFILSLG